DDAKSHRPSELYAQVSQAADALDRYQVPSSGRRVSKRIVSGEARTDEGCCFRCRQFVRNGSQRMLVHEHNLSVSTVVRHPRNALIKATDKIPPSARRATETRTAQIADRNPLANSPSLNTLSQGVDFA